MARLPTAGNPLQFSTIRFYMGLTNPNSSLDQTEVTAMGGILSANASAANSLCMPYQLEAAKSVANGGFYAPNANWESISSTFGSTNWRAARMSEFFSSYNSKPVISVSNIGSGNRDTFTLRCQGSNSDAGSPYYFWVNTNLGTAAGLDSWQSGSPTKDYSFSGMSAGTATFQIWIQDSEGCGNKLEFKKTPNQTYP